MKRQRTLQELKEATYLSKTDIRRLFDVSQKAADKIYSLARRIDDQELGEWVIYDTKVRKQTVMQVQGIKKGWSRG